MWGYALLLISASCVRANNPNAPEQSQAIRELQRVFVSGDCDRYKASILSKGSIDGLLIMFKVKLAEVIGKAKI